MAAITITGAGTEIPDVGEGAAQVVVIRTVGNLVIYLTSREEIISFAQITIAVVPDPNDPNVDQGPTITYQSAPEYNISEDAGPLTVTLLRQNSREGKQLSFTVLFIAGTATAGVNYTTAGAPFLFPVGESALDRDITILNAHSGVGVNKTFKVRLGIPPNRDAYTMGPVSEAVITINGVA